MSKAIQSIFAIVFILSGIAVFAYFRSCAPNASNQVESQDATILLDRIEKVTKLITVEGYFSEVYKYKDYYKYDISLLRKEALLRIKAKVSVGYDLSGLEIVIDESNKNVILTLPDSAQILSMEHDLDYYDLSEGTFNTFDEADYNKLEDNAKTFIREKAMESDLFDNAEQQLSGIVDIIKALATGSGYELTVLPAPEPNSEKPKLSN